MKKILPALIVAAIVAAAVAFFLNRKQDSDLNLAAGRGAELAPGNALVYVELPDIARSAERWNATDLHAITVEPEWQEFLGKWDEFKAQNEVAKSAFGVIADIEGADPAGFFVAVTAVDGPFPKLVGGFPYRGKKSDVEGVIRQLREQLLAVYPAARSDITKLEDTEVETLTDKDFLAAMAFRDNWFFFATDLDLLGQTLARYAGKPDALPGLAKDPLYSESRSFGTAEPDVVAWGRWSAITDKLNAFVGMTGASATPGVKSANPTEAVLYTAKMDGGLMREQLYMHTKEGPKAAPFANRSVGFTQAATYAYGVVDYSEMEGQIKEVIWMLAGMGATDELTKALEPKGLKVEDIFTTFGPELALMSAWEESAPFPDLFLSLELRDAAKGRLFAEVIAAEMMSGENVTNKEEDGTTYWSVTDQSIGTIQPTLAVNGKHMMFGLNGSVIQAGLKQMKTSGANLASHPGSPYPAALKTVMQPTGGLLYVDAKMLFEQLYDIAKPFVAMSLVGDPEVAKHFDAGKLPQAATISKHLSPVILSFGVAEHGWKVESTGTVSFMGAYGFALPAAFLGTARMAAPPAPPAVPAQPAPSVIEDAAPAPGGGNPP